MCLFCKVLSCRNGWFLLVNLACTMSRMCSNVIYCCFNDLVPGLKYTVLGVSPELQAWVQRGWWVWEQAGCTSQAEVPSLVPHPSDPSVEGPGDRETLAYKQNKEKTTQTARRERNQWSKSRQRPRREKLNPCLMQTKLGIVALM